MSPLTSFYAATVENIVTAGKISGKSDRGRREKLC